MTRCLACSAPIEDVRVCCEAGPLHEECARVHLLDAFEQPAAVFTAWVSSGNRVWLQAWREWCVMHFGWVRPRKAA